MGDERESIGGLFARLADDASMLVRAEVELYRAAALHRLALSRNALILLGTAILLAHAALICLLIMLAIALSSRIGALWAGLAVTVCTLLLAAVLARFGLKYFSQAGSGLLPEDKQ